MDFIITQIYLNCSEGALHLVINNIVFVSLTQSVLNTEKRNYVAKGSAISCKNCYVVLNEHNKIGIWYYEQVLSLLLRIIFNSFGVKFTYNYLIT